MHVLEPIGEQTGDPCACCKHVTRTVWGQVSDEHRTLCVYFMRWTDAHVDRGVQLIVSAGAWGEGTTPADRRAVALELRIHDGAPSFMVTDAADSPWARHEMLGRMLPRARVIGTPLAKEIFALVDVIYLEDARLAQLLEGS